MKHTGNINSLPLWAQEYIRRLEAARREADRRYNELVDRAASAGPRFTIGTKTVRVPVNLNGVTVTVNVMGGE